MKNRINVTFGFTRYESEVYDNITESYTNSFDHDDDNTYQSLLEKFQVMLQAMGYVLGDNVVMVANPNDVVTDIDSNIVNFFPKDPE